MQCDLIPVVGASMGRKVRDRLGKEEQTAERGVIIAALAAALSALF